MQTVRDLDIIRTASTRGVVRMAGGEGEQPQTMEVRFSRFGTWYEIDSSWEGAFLERVAPGAFKRTINQAGGQVRCLFNHGMDPTVGDKVLGEITSLREEPDSPVGEVELFTETSYVKDLLPGLAAGVYGSSFRMRVIVDEWNDDPGTSDENPKGLPERTIKEVRLFEFGPVTFPANPDSTAGLRSSTDTYYAHLRSREPQRVDALRSQVAALGRDPLISRDTSPEPEPDPVTSKEPDEATSDDEPVADSDPAARHSETTPAQAPEATPSERTSTMPRPATDHRMSVEERAARQGEINARMVEIEAEYTAQRLPEEVRAEWDSLVAEHVEHAAVIDEQRARQEQLAALAGDPARLEAGSPQRSAPQFVRKVENPYDLVAIRQQARSDEEHVSLLRDNAMRAIDSARFGGRIDRADAQANVERLLDSVDDRHGTLARSILVTGSPVYERAFGKAVSTLSTASLTVEEQRALAVGSGPTGGYAVPFQLDPTVILTSNGSTNPLRRIARVEQIVGNVWKGITSAGVTVSRATEAQEANDDSPALAQPEVKAERVQGFVPFSLETEQDWTAMTSEITTMLADAKDLEETTSFVTGNGTAPNPAGLLTALAAGSNVVGNSFTLTALYDLVDALPDRFEANASFLAHRSLYTAVRQFDTAGGAALWVQLGKGTPSTLMDYSAHRISSMPDSNLSIGKRYLLFGDFRQFLIVDRIGMHVELVPHLFGPNRRPTGQRGVYAVWRNNCKVLVDNAFRVLHKAA